MAPIRAGIIGARRKADGIGEYVARDLAALGAEVSAIAGTGPQTVEEARSNLRQRYGLAVRGYVDVGRMLTTERLDAVAICSPDAFHQRHIELALEHGVHALCEKPLVFEPGRDPVADARPLVEGFGRAGRVLMVNQQWPYTLPFFDRCHPGVRQGRPVEWLEMLMCPAVTGAEMIPNAMPHVLSMLLALAPPGGDIEELEITGPPNALEIHFDYVHSDGCTRVSAVFRQVAEKPRPAGYAINGRGVRRVIQMPDYSMFFEPGPIEVAVEQEGGAAATRVAVDDPLRLLLADFLDRVRNADTPQAVDPTLLESLRLLAEIHAGAMSVI